MASDEPAPCPTCLRHGHLRPVRGAADELVLDRVEARRVASRVISSFGARSASAAAGGTLLRKD